MAPPQRYWLFISSALFFASILYLFITFDISGNSRVSLHRSSEQHAFVAPRQNVWADLTGDEAKLLFDFLHDTPNNLNLTRQPTGSGWENFVRLLEVLHPNKSQAVPYLDGDDERPARWARVVLNERHEPQTRIAEYMVGPLPPGNTTQILPLTYPYNSGRNYVKTPGFSDMDAFGFCWSLTANVSDITSDLIGLKLDLDNPFDPNGLEVRIRFIEHTNETLVSWMTLNRPGVRSGEWSLQPQGIYAKIDLFGRDPSKWRLLQWAYNGRLYNSTDDFRAAWQSPGFVKLPQNLDGAWTDTESFDTKPGRHNLPPPVMAQPQGVRFEIDRVQNYISWMGFTLYLSTSFATGLSIRDLRFDGSRIIYSLELQEALSHYAGSDPIHGGLWFFDAFFGMGFYMSELVPGYDCPTYAEFVDMTYHTGQYTSTNKDSICIFEYTADYPISRHSTDFSTSVSRNTYLVIRTVATVGNYDYTIDYNLYLDGTIEVKYRASGYIIATYHPSFDTNHSTIHPNEYGYRVHDSISSAMHTHILNFRADLDVAGTANTLQRIKISPQTISYPWDRPENPSRNTMHLTTTEVSHETSLNWPRNGQEMYVLSNTDPTTYNTWGQARGYRLMPGNMPGTPSHLAITDPHHSLSRAAPWSLADLFLLKNHDTADRQDDDCTEPRSSSPYSVITPSDPLVDFAAMLADNESTLQEDLVVYFNLGSHHVPTTADIPNTLGHVSGSSVMMVPWNYFARDPSRDTVGGVRLDRGAAGDTVRRFGGHYVPGAEDGLEPELGGEIKHGLEGSVQGEHQASDEAEQQQYKDSQSRRSGWGWGLGLGRR